MSTEESQWKQKYLASLDRYERKEKDWRSLEELLTLAMARVAIAAEGVDDSLDRQLKNLRKSLHSENYQGLETIVDDISRCVKHLDEQRRGVPVQGTSPVTVLQELLDSLSFPRQVKGRVTSLQKQLQQNQPEQFIDAALRELAGIINDSLLNDTAPVARQRGLLERLLAPAAPTSSAVELAGNNLLQLLQHIGDQLHDHAQLEQLSQQLRYTRDEANLQTVTSALARMINSTLAAGTAASRSITLTGHTAQVSYHNDEASGAVEISGFCLRLLQTLQLPAEFEPQVQQLNERLMQDLDVSQGVTILNDIADLISATRARAEKEKRELQEFLQQLTVRLKDIDLHLAGAETHTQASITSRKTLGDVVEAQMKGIETSVQDAAELSQLKLTVQERLEAIRTHILAYQQHEEQSYRELLDELAQSNTRLHDLEMETEQLRARLSEEHAQAIQDKLTGVYNRLAYEERIEQEYQRWKRYKKPLVFLVFDVDHFKAINDNYGHKAGDKALRLIAQTLQKNLREADFLARYGGEEFVVIMPETGIADAMKVADKLREAIAAVKFNYQEREINITISCGAAQFKRNDTVESVFQRADQSLYQAKQNGRNQCYTDDR